MPLYLGNNKIGRVDIMKRVTLDNVNLEQKTVNPTQQAVTYNPNDGYDGFSQFTVNAAPLQSKNIKPTESIQTITTDATNYGLYQVTVEKMKLGTISISENGTYNAPSGNLDGYKQVTVDIPDNGIQPIIANDGSITPTGTYATSDYYNVDYGVKIGYMANSDVMLSMQGGTTTAYENLYFYASSLPDGVILTAPSTFGAGNAINMMFVCIISGLTSNANIAISMSTRNSSQDYVRCDLTITYV